MSRLCFKFKSCSGQQLPYGCSYMPSQHLHPQQAPPLASQAPYSHPQPGQPYGVQQPPAQAPSQAPFYTPQQPQGQARPPSFPSVLTSSGYAPFNHGQMQAYPSQGPYNQQGPSKLAHAQQKQTCCRRRLIASFFLLHCETLLSQKTCPQGS